MNEIINVVLIILAILGSLYMIAATILLSIWPKDDDDLYR
jgi:hypothetical protein